MKLSTEVSSDKLRGGFYTPASLVDVCLDRISGLSEARRNLTVLEPSVGDGAFLRRLIRHRLSSSIKSFVGIEIMEAEAQKCREAGRQAPFDVSVDNMSALEWAVTTDKMVDVVVGNPPFVRYQFVPRSDLKVIEQLGKRVGLTFRGVSNLWIPVVLGALSRLKVGGTMALVVPAEVFTGLSAGDIRSWLIENFDHLRIDMFAPGSFPTVLQEIVVVSGRRVEKLNSAINATRDVLFVEHASVGGTRSWSHIISKDTQGWTRYLLTPIELNALQEVKNLPYVQAFGTIAKLEVSIVTGANAYFSVTSEQVKRYQLHDWVEPLLPRIRYSEGLVYSCEDHKITASNGARAWLLNFSERRPDPQKFHGATAYIETGETQGLHKRYKTRIRSPWYRVPSVWAGKLMLSKRSHRFPRLILNNADALTTDTIYRGNILPFYAGREADLVGAFHNSLTLLTAEIEGRSFGGGVLELVPSEIARLSIPFPVLISDKLPQLDEISRTTSRDQSNPMQLIEATDDLLRQRVDGLTKHLVDQLRQARETLANRRFSRN
jgi:adenine-specific DNA-methyltransferase